MENGKTKKILKIIGNILTVSALGLIVYRLVHYDIDYSVLFNGSNLLALILFSIVYSIILLIEPLSWKMIIHFLGYKQVTFRETQTTFCKCNLMKYIPGNVMQYIGRNETAVKHDLRHSKIAFSTILDILANVIGVGLVALICYGKGIGIFLDKYDINEKLMAIVLIVAIAAAIIAIILLRIKYRGKIQGFDLKKYCFCILVYVFFAFYTSGIYILIMQLILKVEIPVSMITTVIGAYLLSWLFGFLTPGAPGGIGIREATITMLLGGFLQDEMVLLAIVVYRIVNTIGDVMAYGFCMVRDHFNQKKKEML